MLDGLHSPGGRVAGWYSGGGKRAAASLSLPRWVPAMSCEQAALARLASSLPLPPKPAWHRPGSRWPLAAGLARSSVHYRAAMEKKMAITKIAISISILCTYLKYSFTRGKKSVCVGKQIRKQKKDILSNASVFGMENNKCFFFLM